jgi:hypothetical protein
MAAPVLAGLCYDWRPISIFPISLGILGMTFLMSNWFIRRQQKQVITEINVNSMNLEEFNED